MTLFVEVDVDGVVVTVDGAYLPPLMSNEQDMHLGCIGSSITPSLVKALVWFWIIDETYALTFVMSCDMS